MAERQDGPERLIALEVRSRRFGFAVVEDMALLECGACRYGRGAERVPHTLRKFSALLERYEPLRVIVRQHSKRHSESCGVVMDAIRAECRRRSIDLIVINRDRVREFYEARGCTAKHETSALLVKWFPDVKWKLYRKRKPWDHEWHNVVVFDALSCVPVHDEAVTRFS